MQEILFREKGLYDDTIIGRHISQIELCDWHIDDHNTTTLYFTAPKEMLNGEYPEADSMTISVEFPTDHMEACCASAMYSPTAYNPEEDGYSDYDWHDMDISYEDIERLFKKAEKMSVIWKNKN